MGIGVLIGLAVFFLVALGRSLYTLSATISGTALGRQMSMDVSISTDNVAGAEPTVGAAASGTLTTRTDNTTGTITASATGHGVTTGAKFDIYFSGGRRRRVTAGTVAGTSVPFSVGSGDNLPLVNAAVTFMVPDSEPCVVAAANVGGLVAYSQARGNVVFCQSDGTVIAEYNLEAGQSKIWTSEMAETTPVGADCDHVLFSHDDSTQSRQLRGNLFHN